MSGTCKKLLLFGLDTRVGGEGATRAKISATGTWRKDIIFRDQHGKHSSTEVFWEASPEILTIGESVNARLVSSFTSLESTDLLRTNSNIFSPLVNSNRDIDISRYVDWALACPIHKGSFTQVRSNAACRNEPLLSIDSWALYGEWHKVHFVYE